MIGADREQGARISNQPSETAGTSNLAALLRERAPGDQLALKDRALDVAAEGVTIADARLPDRPLIYVNEGFERVTGYPAAEVLGRNCRFLQGPDTDRAAVERIRAAVAGERECVVEILNYRRDGTPFWNRLSITPVRDETGEATHFIGIQSDVTARRNAEEGLRHAKEALEHEVQLAARVQQSLLPPPEMHLPGLRVARAFHPCTELAGDAMGVVPLPLGSVGLYLADVSGHGVGAALLSFTLNHLLAPSREGSLLVEDAGDGPATVSPARLAGRLNRQFPMERTRQYFTLVYGAYDDLEGRFRYVVAGHPPPLLLRRGAPPVELPGRGLPIGMIESASYRDETVSLAPGDRIYLYTDGVTEALDASEVEFGPARLMAEIDRTRELPLREGLELLAHAVRNWSDGGPGDDVSLLAIERVAQRPGSGRERGPASTW
ncbi:MAG: SpoIIE family protein phosphatase [Holophagales bacterium]|nr:SpoIIE family protein phosphatase [Holophagales bacterium]